MKNLDQIVHNLDNKAIEILDSALGSTAINQAPFLDADMIQEKINKYKSYIKFVAAFAALLLCISLYTLLFGKTSFQKIVFLDFAWLGTFFIISFPIYYIFKKKIGRLKRALYLKKIKNHLENVVKPGV